MLILLQICHTAAIVLTIILAIWRLLKSHNLDGKASCTTQRARWSVAFAYVLSIILCIPVYLGLSILNVDSGMSDSMTIKSTNVNITSLESICFIIITTNQTVAGPNQYVVGINAESFPVTEKFMFLFYR